MVPTAGLTCRQLVEIVTDYLEGSLPLEDRARFEEHVPDCRPCANYLEQLRSTVSATRSLSEGLGPEAAQAGLLRIFRDWKA